MKKLKKTAVILLAVLLLGLCGCDDESARIKPEDIYGIKYTGLQTIFLSAAELNTIEDISEAAEKLELFVMTDGDSIFVSKRRLPRSPLLSGDPYTEIRLGEDGCRFAHYRSDFQSADAYYYGYGEWLGMNEPAKGEATGYYIANQPDTFIEGDSISCLPLGDGEFREFIRFDTGSDAVLRLQEVLILLA